MSVIRIRGISNKLLLTNTQKILNSHQNLPRHFHINYLASNQTLVPLNYTEDSHDPIKSKVAIVTGDSRDIGYHIADKLIEREAEAVILANTNLEDMENSTKLLNKKFGECRALFQPTDTSNSEEMLRLFKGAKDRFKKIDIVINNGDVKLDASGHEKLNENVVGLVRGTFLGFEEMMGHGGIIINSSLILEREPMNRCPIFSKTNQFVIGLTRSMSQNYFFNPTNVKIIALCPDILETQLEPINETKHLRSPYVSFSNSSGEDIGKAVLQILKDGENGCVWIQEAGDVNKISHFYSHLKPTKPLSTLVDPQLDGDKYSIINKMELDGRRKKNKKKKRKRSRCAKRKHKRKRPRKRNPMDPPHSNMVKKEDPCPKKRRK